MVTLFLMTFPRVNGEAYVSQVLLPSGGQKKNNILTSDEKTLSSSHIHQIGMTTEGTFHLVGDWSNGNVHKNRISIKML